MNHATDISNPEPAAPGASLALWLHADDNVATALQALENGQAVTLRCAAGNRVTVSLREPIGLCHKFALHDIAAGDMIRKYGEAIGRATCAIRAGEHVHVHNLRSNRAA